MRRLKLGLVGFAASAAALVGVGAMAPAAHADYTLVKVCVTLQPRSIALTVGGHPVVGHLVQVVPRTCVGL